MTNYVKTTNFTAKDSLLTGDPGKLVKGYDFDVEFDNIATAVASKANLASPSFIGTPTAPTASVGTNNTQLATTAYVYSERSNVATLTNKTISGGTISGITDLAIEDGGTGASSVADARTNLDVPSRDGGDATGTWDIDISGNAATVTDGVYTTGDQTIEGVKTFNDDIYVNNYVFVGMKDSNLGFGYNVFSGTVTGTYNTSVGTSALRDVTTGEQNTALGNATLTVNLSGAANTAVGYAAGFNVVGSNNTLVGKSAGFSMNSGAGNTIVGSDAGTQITSGEYNTIVGYSNATGLTIGTYNVGIGTQVFEINTMTGDYNVGIGHGAGYKVTSGTNNVFLGNAAGTNVTEGEYNIYIGSASGSVAADGDYNIYIGAAAGASASTAASELVINSSGLVATGKGDNTGFITVGGGIYQGNNSSSWATTSDQRIKENFVSVTDGLSIINALNPVEFDYITTKKHDVGFKAQEYMEVLPSQVFQHVADGEEKAIVGEDKIYGIQRNLDPYLVSAIKELTKRLEEAEAKLEALTNGS